MNYVVGQRTQVIVLFLCRQNIPLGAPEFVRKEENAYYFDFKTALACRPQPVDCQVQDDKGNQYDLSPLARAGTNWQVLDSRADYSDLTYYINVCRPINTIAGSTCPGKAFMCVSPESVDHLMVIAFNPSQNLSFKVLPWITNWSCKLTLLQCQY